MPRQIVSANQAFLVFAAGNLMKDDLNCETWHIEVSGLRGGRVGPLMAATT